MTLDVSAPPVAAVDVGADAGATPEAVYQARTRQFAAERDRYRQQWNRVSNIRLGVFVVAPPYSSLAKSRPADRTAAAPPARVAPAPRPQSPSTAATRPYNTTRPAPANP